MTDFVKAAQPARPGLDMLAAAIIGWHRTNFADPVDLDDTYTVGWLRGASTVLGVTKVAEEAGELVGAVTRYVEGRPDLTDDQAADNAYAELGDVIIAAVGALRRLNDLTGQTRGLADVILDRWATVGARTYAKPKAYPEPIEPPEVSIHRYVAIVGNRGPESIARHVDAWVARYLNESLTTPRVTGDHHAAAYTRITDERGIVIVVPVHDLDTAHRLGACNLTPADVIEVDPVAHTAHGQYVRSRIRQPAPAPWECPKCGSARWVAASLTGPVSHGGRAIKQCVPCGHYSDDAVTDDDTAAMGRPTATEEPQTP